VTIYGEPSEYANIKQALNEANLEIQQEEITFLPLQTVEVTGEDLQKFERLVDGLDELDDVQHVYHNAN
jgi:transcriptional/translational regulatory protein YebC/TACO1